MYCASRRDGRGEPGRSGQESQFESDTRKDRSTGLPQADETHPRGSEPNSGSSTWPGRARAARDLVASDHAISSANHNTGRTVMGQSGLSAEFPGMQLRLRLQNCPFMARNRMTISTGYRDGTIRIVRKPPGTGRYPMDIQGRSSEATLRNSTVEIPWMAPDGLTEMPSLNSCASSFRETGKTEPLRTGSDLEILGRIPREMDAQLAAPQPCPGGRFARPGEFGPASVPVARPCMGQHLPFGNQRHGPARRCPRAWAWCDQNFG